MTVFGPGTQEAIDLVRSDVAVLHDQLTRYGLVVWTGGNVSGRVPGHDLFVIKPSGVEYDDLAPSNMILCDLDGRVIRGSDGSDRSPSSDTAAHAYVYRHMSDVGGIVHTHSTYATAWAARGEPVPCVITGQADEFGGEIPIGPFAIIGDESIGEGIVATLTGHRSRAVLMQSHGVFTIGSNPRDAVKAAVMAEDVARTVHIARQLGALIPIPQEKIDALFHRYQNVYGQRGNDSPDSPAEFGSRPGRERAGAGLTAGGSAAKSPAEFGSRPGRELPAGRNRRAGSADTRRDAGSGASTGRETGGSADNSHNSGQRNDTTRTDRGDSA